MRAGRASVVAVGDAVVSSTSNLLVQAVAAAVLSARDFGWFSLAVTTALFLLGLGRCLAGEVDLLRGSPQRDGRALSAVLWLSGLLVAVALPVLALGAAGSRTALWAGLALLCAPALLVQDAQRYRALRQHRADLALRSDAVWLLLVVALVPLGAAGLGAAGLFLVWVGGALVATAAGGRVWARASWRSGPAWVVSHRDVVVPAVGEHLLRSGLPLVLNVLIAALAGPEVLAGYRLALLLFGAPAVLANGLNAVFAARMADALDLRALRRRLDSQLVLSAGTCALVAAGCLLVPERWATALFGGSWLAAAPFLLPAAVEALAGSAAVPVSTALRLLGLSGLSLRIRVVTTASTALACAAVAPALGVAGVAAASAAVAAAGTLARTAVVRRQLRLGEVGQVPVAVSGSPGPG